MSTAAQVVQKPSRHGGAFYCPSLPIKKPALAARVGSRFKTNINGIKICHSRVCPSGRRSAICDVCAMPLYMFIWLSSHSPLKREYVTADVTFKKKKKRSFEATLLSVPVRTAQWLTKCSARFCFIRVRFKIYLEYLEPGPNLHPSLPQDTSVVVVAFKCHTGLDTWRAGTPGTQLNTSHRKHRLPLSFLKSDIQWSQESRRGHRGAPEGTTASANRHLFLPEPP